MFCTYLVVSINQTPRNQTRQPMHHHRHSKYIPNAESLSSAFSLDPTPHLFPINTHIPPFPSRPHTAHMYSILNANQNDKHFITKRNIPFKRENGSHSNMRRVMVSKFRSGQSHSVSLCKRAHREHVKIGKSILTFK